MSKIGSFKKVSGELRGEIITLSVQAKSVRIVPVDSNGANAPSHRVMVGEADVGAAWSKRTSDDRPYLSLKFDDPSFVAPVFAQLFEGQDGEYDLVWTRPVRRDRDPPDQHPGVAQRVVERVDELRHPAYAGLVAG